VQHGAGPEFLTTAEAAAYLRLRERKLYELVADRCTKVTGKWLLSRGRSRPLVIGGNGTATRRVPGRATADCRRQPRSLVAVGAERERCRVGDPARGQRRGYRRLLNGEVIAAAIHFHALDGAERDVNVDVVRDEAALYDAVLIAFATREQGLLVAPGNPLSLAGVAEVGDRQLRLAVRPEGAGAQQLLLGLLQRHRLWLADAGATVPAHTGPDVAQAIRADRADCGIATRAVATAAGVGFLPLCLERFDLLLRQRDYFRPAWQSLLKLFADPRFAAQAGEFGGLDVSAAGSIRWAP